VHNPDLVGPQNPKLYQVRKTLPLLTKADTYEICSGYMGAATNIATDLLYTIAPLIYISRVQLRKRTIWGVRIVFLLGLM
jgi:hypothetical protein